jgi:conjugative relaxase-like TrwC/TraI family protein
MRVNKLTDAEYVLRDVVGGIEDYYLGCGEAPGVWAGGLAASLGLAGVVEADQLRVMIEGRDPTSGTALLQHDPKRKVKAYDVTLSAPKSASLLWALGSPEVSAVVAIAHVEAVAAALEFLDERAGVTRQQSGGVRRRVATSGLAMATFVHRTSREGDPQLHTHCVIPNMVQRQDGSWVAIDGAPTFTWAKAAGSIYQEELRRRLSGRLGVAWGPDRSGCREMLGFTEEQLEQFSKRTRQIDEYRAAKGKAPADPKERMKADEAASLATRRAKDRSLTPERLRGRWEHEAAEVGLPRGKRLERQVAEAGRGRRRRLSASDLAELFDRLVDPEVGLCARDSRFGEAQVIEHVAAFGAGQLSSEQIQRLATAFLRSDRVVRLIDRDPSGRTPPRWSTVAHRRIEDRVVADLEVLQQRSVVPIPPTVVEGVIAARSRLGADQAEAVRVLAGPGPALRGLIAPAGHGKTTAVVTAADAVRAAGRPVVALASTNQAVGELRRVGLEAATVARFALDGCPLQPDSVVILDELSQLPTVEADLVLSAVAGCQGGQLWLVGDPLQAQPVRAAGLGPLVADLVAEKAIPAASLTLNRRQTDPEERSALARYRSGDPGESQQLRRTAGLEHEAANPERARQAMADAVVDAVERLGARQVAALAVSHADCEDVADRIRRRLIERGLVGGEALSGPGWVGRRTYQSGDRTLLHAHLDVSDGRRLPTGTPATVVAVGTDGLLVRPDAASETVLVPAAFVAARRTDGRPQLSHAWWRTIDGVQGGTWSEVHMLGTIALDRYRGYVGQSRATTGTHTWNTRPGDPGDHGGRLVRDAATPAEEVLRALRRAESKTFAAFDDPYRLANALERELSEHRRVLSCRPHQDSSRLADARAGVAAAERALRESEHWITSWQAELEATSGRGRLRRSANGRHREAHAALRTAELGARRDRECVESCRRELADLERKEQAGRNFDRAEGWRHERIYQLGRKITEYWGDVVLAAARAGEPLAYGKDHLVRSYEALLDRSRLHPDDPTAGRALGDLDRAILAARPATAGAAKQDSRHPPAVKGGHRPSIVERVNEPVRGREGGISL